MNNSSFLSHKLLTIQLLMILLSTPYQIFSEESEKSEITHSSEISKISQNKTESVVFTPPKGWTLADSSKLPPRVSVMVIGPKKNNFPPSINLSTEPFDGTVKDYLAIVKRINASNGSDWKDLGTIKTEAGEASLSQAENKTEWGIVRMMHVILSKNDRIYILTAAATKDEFSLFYKDFFESLKSLKIIEEIN